jgi:hypothetical protein
MHQGTWALDLVDKYFIEAQDYEGIIAIHKEQIKNGRGSSKDYIQIGNAYLNLGDKEKSKKALKLGLEGLKNSKESSAKKEIEALNKFIESIDKQ